MKQINSVEVSVVKHRTMLLRPICLLVILVGLMIPVATPTVKAQTRYISSPTKWYLDMPEVLDKLYPDYAVEFDIPINATNIVVYTTTAGVESRVLAFSTQDPRFLTRNGKRVIRMITGYRARKCSSSYNPLAWTCNYTGTVYQWACSLRVRYYR